MLSKVKSLFQRKVVVTVLFKSGATLKFKCDKVSIDSRGNDIIQLTYPGHNGREPFYIRLDDISAITYK